MQASIFALQMFAELLIGTMVLLVIPAILIGIMNMTGPR
jgi:hypothetical protein